jgi:hypothetical protein
MFRSERERGGEYLDVSDFVESDLFSEGEGPSVRSLSTSRTWSKSGRKAALWAVIGVVALACTVAFHGPPRLRSLRATAVPQEKVQEAASWVPPPPPLPPSDEAAADEAGLGMPPPPPAPPPDLAKLSAPADDASKGTVADHSRELKPEEDLHDGNVCEHDEEHYGGLCYRKCSILTQGSNPIRTSPWTCCREHPCGLSNQLGNLGHKVLCNGFDVAGDGSCPHRPGACLKDEEITLGVCYKKCSLLTNGEYPNRVAPLTCCKDKGLSCLDLFKDKTRPGFGVGGGGGDHDPSTPSTAHFPQRRWTEDVNSSATPPSSISSGSARADEYSAPTVQLKPDENLHDGNVCEANEEKHGGLCYKKCGLLTNGQARIRTSAWTCCEDHPCTFANQHGKLGDTILCDGYDVAGDGSCPHTPGACLKDEELLLGVCYKKCEILTQGLFPHRVTPVTCCKEEGVECFDLSMEKTRLQFAMGGGKGDHDPSTPALAHPPRQRWTEART